MATDIFLGSLAGALRGAADVLTAYTEAERPAHLAYRQAQFDLNAVAALRQAAFDYGIDDAWATERYRELRGWGRPEDAYAQALAEITGT